MKRVAYISAALVVAMMLASGCSSDIAGPDIDGSALVGDPANFGAGSSTKTDPIGDGPIPMLPKPKDLPDPFEDPTGVSKPGKDPVADGPVIGTKPNDLPDPFEDPAGVSKPGKDSVADGPVIGTKPNDLPDPFED